VKDKEDILHHESENVVIDDQDKHPSQDEKWWEGESQFLLNSQQLAECMSICDEFLQSQNSCGSEDEHQKSRPRLAEYGHLPADELKKDLEECQKLDDVDNTNLELECTPEFRLSQLVNLVVVHHRGFSVYQLSYRLSQLVNLAVVHHRGFSVYQLSYLVLIFCLNFFSQDCFNTTWIEGKI
jgi:acetolactate synthase regulatory subunit